MKQPHSILITGASSGIGAALAEDYAAPGVHLTLTGRNEERLEEVAARCRAAGAEAVAETVDVTDAAAMDAAIERAHGRQPLDLVIANAGVSAGTGQGSEPPDQTRRIFSINVDGVINTVAPAVERIRAKPAPTGGERWRGQVAIVSSLAGFRGFPGAPAYCASKAAVRVWGEALRGELDAHGIAVSVICPGYVRTPLTARNRFSMPLLMDADRAARIVRRALARNRGRIAFPRRMYWLVWLLAGLPSAWTDFALRRLPRKD